MGVEKEKQREERIGTHTHRAHTQGTDTQGLHTRTSIPTDSFCTSSQAKPPPTLMFCPAKPEKALRSGMSYLSSVRITDLSAADMKMLLSALILVPALSCSSCSSFSQ